MRRCGHAVIWLIVFTVMAVMAVPWFWWGSSRLWAGIPLWVWYHAGWLIGAALLFWVFVRVYWAPGNHEE